MSLLPLIRFRNLDAQLTDDEFFHQFTKSVGRELITKLLFNHFQNNLNEISTITNIQSDIINKREENQQQILSHDCIDKLPSELISECASYLNYRQYFRLARCNRKIYIACYTFPKIQELNLSDVRNAMSESTDLNAFKNIQNLTMEIKDFNALSASNKLTWSSNSSLHTLDLGNVDGNQNDLRSFVNNQHLINYNNVTTLKLDFFRSELIGDILSKFTQVQNLKLWFFKLTFRYLPGKNEIKKWFPHVKSLDFFHNNIIIASNIIEALHNQLESLIVDNTVTIPSNITFPKLQSLELLRPTNLDVLNRLQTLKCITVESCKEDIINSVIENTIYKQLALENVKIVAVNVNSFSSLHKIESLLAKKRNIERKCKRLCIELIFKGADPDKDDKKEFGLQIFRVSNALKVSNIDNWCLKIDYMYYNFDKEHLENELNEMKRNYFVHYQIIKSGYNLTIVISNRK